MLGTCLGCGCACDDIELTVAGNRIVEARHACALGAAWYGDGSAPSRIRAAGRDAALDEALSAATQLLIDAGRPLIYLAPDISCEAQREAIAIADAIAAIVDSVTSATALTSIVAAQEIGRASATLGEIRNRADLIVFWGVDPAQGYPRYGSRYAPQPSGVHVPGGRTDRHVVAVDIGTAKGPEDANLRLQVAPEQEVATLTTLRAALSEQRAIPEQLVPFVSVLRSARYVALVADAEPDEANTDRDRGRAGALIAFVQALNGITRAALSTLRAGGNRSGADACLTSQTGYPLAVDFSRGYPRYRAFDGRADVRLRRGEIDAILVVGSAALIPAVVTDAIGDVPLAIVGPRASDASFPRIVAAIDAGVAGIHESGTALRMDDVPLPVPAVVSGPPAVLDLAQQLRARLRDGKKMRPPLAVAAQ